MKLTRIVEQEAVCTCLNMCVDGQRQPDPLDSMSDENQMGDYCEKCPKLAWNVVREIAPLKGNAGSLICDLAVILQQRTAERSIKELIGVGECDS